MPYQRLNRHQWEKPPWEFKIATGFGGRFSAFHKMGYNPSVGKNNFEDIWNVGENLVYLSDAEPMNISSSSAADKEGEPGAHKIKMVGVDGNYNLLEEEIALDGTNTITTHNSFLRVFRMFITDVGNGDVNEGDITATASGAGTIQSRIDEDVGQSLMGLTTIPEGFFGFLTSFKFAGNGEDEASVELQMREENKGWLVVGRGNLPSSETGGGIGLRLQAPVIFPPRTDLKMRGQKETGGITPITGNFSFYLIDQREMKS